MGVGAVARIDDAAITQEQAFSDVEHALYRRHEWYDPEMPELWQRSGTTSSFFYSLAREFVTELPWLKAYIESLPSEDDDG